MVNTRCPLPIFPAALPARAGQGKPPRNGSSSTDQSLSAHFSSRDAKPEELERRLHRAEYLANKECHQSRSFVRIHRRLVGSKPGTPARERGWPYHRKRVTSHQGSNCALDQEMVSKNALSSNASTLCTMPQSRTNN